MMVSRLDRHDAKLLTLVIRGALISLAAVSVTIADGGISYSGTGYVVCDQPNSMVEWTVDDLSGPCLLVFRYAAEAGARPCVVTINGGDPAKLILAPTGMPTSWASAYHQVELKKGRNVIRIMATKPRVGLRFDRLDILERSRRDTPNWIWKQGERKPGQSAYFRRNFQCAKGLVEAQLRVLTGFHNVEVRLNGILLGQVENYGPILKLPVTDKLVAGENVLACMATLTDGPAALAIELEMTFADGRIERIFSDSSWPATGVATEDWASIKADESQWHRAVEYGPVSRRCWGRIGRPLGISELDDYTQWKQALGSSADADPSRFLIADGFEIKRIRSARPDEGSWVSLAFDPTGRMIIAREKQGLLRLTFDSDFERVQRVELVNDSLLECRGLVFADGALYANANNSKALYRLRDTNGDDQFDDVRLVFASQGGVGHGRNDLAVGPGGRIYSIHGDSVSPPADCLDRTSPLRKLEPGFPLGAGHVISLSSSGKEVELLATGLRNPYGLAFSPAGELFTYDADAEHDMGAPWYRPTRIRHLTSGADYGWRALTGRWPPYYPDHAGNPPSNLDVGKGSPTALCFGTDSRFPPIYRDALFALDWAYGRIIAIHLTPRGASYIGQGETFLKGRPFNATDLAFGPDGAMYVITGGRATQSALYRIRWKGGDGPDDQLGRQERISSKFAAESRKLRRQLETLHRPGADNALATAWPHLDSPDPWIRQAARIAIEHQHWNTWRDRAMREPRPTAALTALMSLARATDLPLLPQVVTRLNELTAPGLTPSQKLLALRSYTICLDRLETVDSKLAAAALRKLDAIYPDVSFEINRSLSRLIVRLAQGKAIAKTIPLLKSAETQQEKLHYLFVLRNVSASWDANSRKIYFRELQRAKHYHGGAGMPQFVHQIAKEALAAVPPNEREQWQRLLEQSAEESESEAAYENRRLVRHWKFTELWQRLQRVDAHPNFARGRSVFRAVLCSRCHQIGGEGYPLGPDLTSVAGRFGRRDILESILSPSKVVAESYRSDLIRLHDGRVLSGRIVIEGDYRSPELQIATDPLHPFKLTTVPKSEIESHRRSDVSIMPEGLLDTLSVEEIGQLLWYVESGGRRDHSIYGRRRQKPASGE